MGLPTKDLRWRWLALAAFLFVVSATLVQAQSPAVDSVQRVQSLWQSGERTAAHALVDSVLPFARASADTTTICRLQILRGVMHTAMGDGARGEPPLREGLALTRLLDDRKWELIALRWLGVALGQNLKDEESHNVFQALLKLAQSDGDHANEGWAECGLAYQSARAGESEVARQKYERSVRIFQAADMVQAELFALNGLGTTLDQLSDFAAARECYTRTLEVSRQIGATFTEALAENNLGTLEFSLGDPGRARSHFQRSYGLQLAAGNLREAINSARNVAICQTNLGAYDLSLAVLDSALQVCRERGYRELEYTALTQKGLVYSLQGRPGRANQIFSELADWTDSLPTGAVLERALGQALALARLDRTEAGRDLLLAHQKSALAFDEPIQRLAYLAHLGAALAQTGQPGAALARLGEVRTEAAALHLAGPQLTALAAMGSAWRHLDQPDSALAAYRAAAAVWERERGVPRDPEWRERRGLFGEEIYTELADLTLGEGGPDEVRETYQLLQGFKARTLFERMVGPQRTAVAPPVPMALADLQQSLHPVDEILLDFFVGRRVSFLFAVTHDEINVCRLAAAPALAGQVELYRDLVTAAVATDSADQIGRRALLTSGARSLQSALLGPLVDLATGCRRVIYCPDGVLNRLPLALVLGTGQIVDRVPSASILTRLREGTNGPRPALAVRRILAVTGGRQATGPALAAAEREVTWLRRRFGGVAVGLSDTVATMTALADFDLIHVASHARVSAAAPWRSTIQVHTVSDTNRTITAAEIAPARLQAGLTVLANCESAGGTVVGGEGVMGLGSAFLATGVPVVVATLWPVDDAATWAFMHSFYQGLAAGKPVSVALVVAKGDLAASDQLADPVYWAGFVVIGDGDRCLNLANGTRYEMRRTAFWAGVVLLCGAGLVGLWPRRQNFL